MKRSIYIALAIMVLFLSAGVAQATDRDMLMSDTGTLGADQYSITSGGSIVPNDGQYKYAYVTISGNGLSPIVGGIGTLIHAAGLAGSSELGSTLGAAFMAEDAYLLSFRFQLPQTFVDGGNAADLDINFYCEEEDDSENISFDVSIYEWPCTNGTAIITDTVTMLDAAAIGWKGLDTLSSGIGADADIDAGDVLTIEISPSGAECDIAISGMRLKYLVGLEVE